MYRANLSYSQLQNYLQLLMEQGLIKEDTAPGKGKVYRRTVKGGRVLERIEELLRELGVG
jgi:predicted transcriptional regulator